MRDGSFAALYRDTYGPVHRYVERRLGATGADVEAVVAEVYVVAWRRRGVHPDPALPWLYGVARWCVANESRRLRRFQRLQRVLGRRGPVHFTPSTDPSGAVHEALAVLSASDQEVLRLSAWEQLPVSELAVALGCTPGAASMRLHRARARLRERLDRLHTTVPMQEESR